ncbi:MAG: hypothetical protein ACRDTI_11570 [Mycobacterium sp.]
MTWKNWAWRDVYTREWARLLDQDVSALVAAMFDTPDHGVTLRSCTPFTGILSPNEVRNVKRLYEEEAYQSKRHELRRVVAS